MIETAIFLEQYLTNKDKPSNYRRHMYIYGCPTEKHPNHFTMGEISARERYTQQCITCGERFWLPTHKNRLVAPSAISGKAKAKR